MADYEDDDAPEGSKKESDEKILEEARDRFSYSEDCDADNRKNAKDDTEFVYVKGKQWDDAARAQRDDERRPYLEINQLPQFVNQVVNDQRQGRPGIRISPASGEASKETAKILQGMIRGIEYESNAEAAYDSAFAHAVTSGRGYWRICSEYEDAQSFNQRICVKRVPDPLSVRMDPDYQEADASDAAWAFVTELLTRDEFEKRWPDAEPLSWDPAGEGQGQWYEGEAKVVIADYYRKVKTPRTLVAMNDGTTGWKDTLPKDLPPGIEIVRERETEDERCIWYKIAGGEQILERYDVPSRYLPLVMCVGDEITVDGKRIFQGLIRRARDSQVMYNFWQTAATEAIAMIPRAPYVAAEGQIEGHEKEWQEANKRAFSVLTYKPQSIGGQPLPPPQRVQAAEVPMAIVQQANQCKQDLRATIGIYDPSLGQRSNETSGRAILAREKQGDTATFHFVDNLSRAIALTGRIILELIPVYYDTQRVVSMIDDEDKAQRVTVNEQVMLLGSVQAIVKNDLSVGKYAVTVDSGPSYMTKRQESADSMMQFVQAYPPAAQLAGDLIAKNMDWPGAEQIANRLRLVLPPAIQQAESQPEGVPPIPPQAAQQMAQMGQQLQQMQQMLQQMGQENQQLKSGVMEKMQIAEMENARKLKESEDENKRKMIDMQTTLQQNHELAISKAVMAINEAKISAQAKIEAQGISSAADIEIAKMKTMMAPEDPALAEALMAIVGQASGMSLQASRPRRSSVEFDAAGNPTGATSQFEAGEGGSPDEPPPGGNGAKPTLGLAILQMAKQMQMLAELATAPRRHEFVMDKEGNPIGTVSRPMLQ